VTREQAWRIVRAAAAESGRVFFTVHAEQRMRERRITRRQVLACLERGAIHQGPAPDIKGNWTLTMERTAARERVRVVLAIAPPSDVIIVTAM
jgi:hypothetical protein